MLLVWTCAVPGFFDDSHRLLFVHIPKSGGTTVEYGLLPFVPALPLNTDANSTEAMFARYPCSHYAPPQCDLTTCAAAYGRADVGPLGVSGEA